MARTSRLIDDTAQVWLGGNVTVIGPCNIGDGVVVAAGAVVKGILEPFCVYAGVPGKIIKRIAKPSDTAQDK